MKRLNFFGFLALVGTALVLEFFQRGNLAAPIPFELTLVGAMCGAGLGYLAAAEAIKLNVGAKAKGKYIALLTFPLFGLFSGTLVMRSLVLQAAFAGFPAETKVASLHVEDADRQRRKGFASKRTYRFDVSLPSGQRSFRVLVDEELYAKVGPKKPPAHVHCIRLPVQKGRWGVQRVLGPNYQDAPLGVESYHTCGQAASL